MSSTLLYQFGILNAQYKYEETKIVILDFRDHSNTLTYHLCTISLIILLCGVYTKTFNQKHNQKESMDDKTSRDQLIDMHLNEPLLDENYRFKSENVIQNNSGPKIGNSGVFSKNHVSALSGQAVKQGIFKNTTYHKQSKEASHQQHQDRDCNFGQDQVFQRPGELLFARQFKMTHTRTMFWVYLIFNISRLLGILLAYMLNTWFSIILLLWVTHSYLVSSLRKFRVDTVRFYLPLIILYYLWEFIVNIDMLLSDGFFGAEAIKDKRYARWGIIRFWGAMWPLICFNLLIYSMFAFIKVSEQIKADQQDNVLLGRDWSTRIARKDSYSFELVLFLSFPIWEKILLAGIILSGLNKGDLYHLAYLFFLIAYLNFPKHKLSIARWSIIYGSIFIITKYVYTLLDIKDIGGQFFQICDLIGFDTKIDRDDSFQLFRVLPKPQQWLVIIAGNTQYFILQMSSDHKIIDQNYSEALKIMMNRYQKISSLAQYFYILKKSITLVCIFVTFYLIIQFKQRSIIFWGFQTLTQWLIYIEISPRYQYKPDFKIRLWKLCALYSSLALVTNWIIIICIQHSIIQELTWVKAIIGLMPDWMKGKPEILGIEILKGNEESGNHLRNYTVFFPHILFLTLSVYAAKMIPEWHEHAKIVQEDMQQLDRSNKKYQNIDTSTKTDIESKQRKIDSIKSNLKDIQTLQNRIQYSGMYFSYKWKNMWGVFDTVSLNNHMQIYFTIIVLQIYWWFNLVNIIMLSTLMIFNYRIGQEIKKKKSNQNKEYGQLGKVQEISLDDDFIQRNKKAFDESIKQSIWQKRLRAWQVNYLIITLSLIIIYPSTHLSLLLDYAKKHEGDDKSLMVPFKDFIGTTIYYMFISGVYTESDSVEANDKSYFGGTYGYLIVFILCLFERICLEWLKNNFGCTEEIYEKIKTLEQIICDHESSINSLEQQIKNHDLIRKRELMKQAKLRKQNYEMKKSVQVDQLDEVKQQKYNISYHDSFLEYQPKMSKEEIRRREREFKKLSEQVKERILVGTEINLLRNFKILMEEIICFMIVSSVIFKLNIIGVVSLLMVVLFYFNRTSRMIRIIMNVTCLMFFINLLVIWSNINHQINPMPYPKMFGKDKLDDQGGFEDYWRFFIPWFNVNEMQSEENLAQMKWLDWLSLYIFEKNLNLFQCQFFIMTLVYIYYKKCEFWILDYEVNVKISPDTEQMLERFQQMSYQRSKYLNGDSLNKNNENSNQSVNFSSLLAGENLSNPQIIEAVKESSLRYRFYNWTQNIKLMHYSRFMVTMIILLAVYSGTIFSFVLIIILCSMMYSSKTFLNVQQARSNLVSIIKKYLIPLILFEIVLSMIYQMPLSFLEPGKYGILDQIVKILGIQKYYKSEDSMGYYLDDHSDEKHHHKSQLWCKAIIYFLLNVQIQMVESHSFEKLTQLAEVYKLKGQAMVYHFNNKKIATYYRYQNINYQRETEMKNVRHKCTQWKDMFESQTQIFKQIQLDDAQEENANAEKKKPLGESSTVQMSQTFMESVAEEKEENSDQNEDPSELLGNETLDDVQIESVQSAPIKKQRLLSSHQSNTHQKYLGVNSDFLAIRKFMQMRDESFNHEDNLQQFQHNRYASQYELDCDNQKYNTMNKNNREFESLYIQKLKSLPVLAKIYIYLRKYFVNPIQLSKSKAKLLQIIRQAKQGEIILISSIEQAVKEDTEQEIKTGKKTNSRIQGQIETVHILSKFFSLFGQILFSNKDQIAYFFMIMDTIQNYGILQMVYPLSIFGYALVQETSPKSTYWYTMMFYTQFLLVIQFGLCLAQSMEYDLSDVKTVLAKYYVGIHIDNKGSKLWDYLTKFLILQSIMTNIHDNYMLDLLDQKETDKENIKAAYFRYIKGQFGVNIIHDDEELEEFDLDQQLELDKAWLQKNSLIKDDWLINYNNLEEYETGRGEIRNLVSQINLEEAELAQELEAQRPYKSEYDTPDEEYKVSPQKQKKSSLIKKTKVSQKTCQAKISKVFVKNQYIQRIYPEIKLQKPGEDYYNILVFIQVFIVVYVILFSTKIWKQGKSITEQLNSNSYNSKMLYLLTISLILMILDRYVFKMKSFVDYQDTNNPNQKSWDTINYQIKKQNIKAAKFDSRKATKMYNSTTSLSQLYSQQSIQGQELDIGNTNTIFARTKINFKSVSGVYYVCFQLLIIHTMLFFLYPIKSMYARTNEYYCDPSKENQECHDFGSNSTLKIYYLLNCLYFYFAALQIKKGIPEVIQHSFMMGNYSPLNRYIFTIFMSIPFLFEMRTFIDWTFTKTNLDVFQWIKLANIQAQLYKAKSQCQSYQNKPIERRIQNWKKNIIGLPLIAMVLILILGPAYVFSPIFTSIGDTNPISKTDLSMVLRVHYHKNETSSELSSNLFKSNSMYKDYNLDDKQRSDMGFDIDKITKEYGENQTQYVVMNEINDIWLISDIKQDQINQQLCNATSELSDDNQTIINTCYKYKVASNCPCSSPEGCKAEKGQDKPSITLAKPDKIYFELNYAFSRGSPSLALNPKGQQNFTLYDKGNSSLNSDYKDSLCQMARIFNNDKDWENKKQIDIDISQEKYNRFQPVISLDRSDDAKVLEKKDWSYKIQLQYKNVSEFGLWTVRQKLDDDSIQMELFKNVTGNLEQEAVSLTLFVISMKKLFGIDNYPLTTIYITFIYAIFKLIRTTFVPSSNRIPIEECKDPTFILMLCETIQLYRLKQMLPEEEELYFLLIDIMRSPDFLKKLSGDSIKSIKNKNQAQKITNRVFKEDQSVEFSMLGSKKSTKYHQSVGQKPYRRSTQQHANQKERFNIFTSNIEQKEKFE